MTDQLKKQAVRGVKWNGVAMAFSTVLRFLTTAVLARLLVPSDFGIMGMVMIIIGFVQVFADMGLGSALIQRQDVSSDHLSNFFWINILTGVFLFACVLLTRDLAVLYFKQPDLSGYLFVIAFLFLITPAGQIYNTLLIKNLEFKTLSTIEITCTLVYSLTAIGFALAGFGVLSLIYGQLLRSLLNTCLLVFVCRKTWFPKFHFRIAEIKSYFSFGAYQTGQRIVNYLGANVDQIIIGRLLGSEALGFYSIAYQTITFPLTKINPVITRVAFPAFAKIQNDNARMRAGYKKIIKYISLATFPLMAGMLVVAPEFIRLVYGAKWAPAVIILQLFCLLGIMKSLGNPVGSVLLAKGRADIGFYWNVFNLLMVGVTVAVGANWGIVGIAVAILILRVPLFFIIHPIVNNLIALPMGHYFKVLLSPFVCSMMMIFGMVLLRGLLGELPMPTFFGIIIAAGALIYIISYYFKDRATLLEAKSMLTGS